MSRPPETRDASADAGALMLHHLREANERLVLTAVRAHMESEAAALRLTEVQRSAELDPLTGLPNRLLLKDRFTHAAALAKRHHTRLALLFIDLNGFKQINDALGHPVGDLVLRNAGSVLVSSMRAADTVSRHGGDEFVVLLTDVVDRSDVAIIAEKVLTALARPTHHGDHLIRLTASIGISLFPDDAESIDALIANADGAMYRAKRGTLRHYAFHGDADPTELADEESSIVMRPRQVIVPSEAQRQHELQRAQLREANEQLVLTVLSARAVQADLEVANRRQAEFMAMLAHQLRNPLAPMRNVSALLARVQPDDPILPRLQQIIERQVVHMARLIDDLVDVSRAHTGKLSLTLHDVELTALVTDAVAQCQSAMDLRLQHFTAIIPAAPVHVQGDAIRLTQIFTNLLDNASKYTPNAGHLSLVMAVDASQVTITLTDTGIGIASEALPVIFELFAQDLNSIGFNGGGLGIGLPIVHELVRAHGGTVVARSDGTNRGSQFVVTLPLHDHHATA